MPAFVYILFSSSLDRFYIGSTRSSPEERLLKHNQKYYGNHKFTSIADDWILYHQIHCSGFSQARKIEDHLKKMKSKIFIKNLKKFPEISLRLLEKFQ